MKKVLFFIVAILITIATNAQERNFNNVLLSIQWNDNVVQKLAYANTVNSIEAYCFIDENDKRFILKEETVSFSQDWIKSEISLMDFAGKIVCIRLKNAAGGSSLSHFEFCTVKEFYISKL